MDQQKIFNALGLVVKANKFVYGQRMVEQMAKNKVYLVITCSDTGISVKKKINDKAKTYHVEIINDLLTVDQLTKLVHHQSPITAIGIIDQNLAKLITTYL